MGHLKYLHLILMHSFLTSYHKWIIPVSRHWFSPRPPGRSEVTGSLGRSARATHNFICYSCGLCKWYYVFCAVSEEDWEAQFRHLLLRRSRAVMIEWWDQFRFFFGFMGQSGMVERMLAWTLGNRKASCVISPSRRPRLSYLQCGKIL